MIRRMLIAIALLASTASFAVAQTPVTFLMRNGQRLVGNMTYKGGGDYTLNGVDYPSSDVAVIAFVPNDPTPLEVSRVPMVDNNPSELERHVFVTRDGSVVFGKLYKFSPDGNIITFDQREGGRHDVAASNMARIYINPAAARVVYGPILAALNTVATSGGTAPGTKITVNGNQAWTDTGQSVQGGEVLHFRTSGEIRFTPSQRANVNGSLDQKRAANTPLPGILQGALIGRVDNGAPFVVGNLESVRMPASGRLFLGINDDIVSDNSGAFTVTVSR